MMCVGANVGSPDRGRSVLFLVKNFKVAGRASGKLNDSTRYVMFSADVVEYFFGGASASVGYFVSHILQVGEAVQNMRLYRIFCICGFPVMLKHA
jgi:hypothetical protein